MGLFHSHANILSDRQKLKAFFKDVLLNDLPKVNAMLAAYDSGVLAALQEEFPLSPHTRGRLVSILSSDYSMQPEMARWAIAKWTDEIDSDTLKQVRSAELTTPEEALEIDAFLLQEDESLVGDLLGKEDSDDYFVNVSYEPAQDKIYIPCGVGRADQGFYIHGIRRAHRCQHPQGNVFALVYNYLLRNSRIENGDLPRSLKDLHTPYEINYRNIFRLQIILLQLIKNNYIKENTVTVQYRGDAEELGMAVDVINNYAALFCRLIKIKHEPLAVRPSAALFIDLSGHTGIFVEENTSLCNARELWTGRKIRYSLTETDLIDLEYILSEIAPFDVFREGQFEALQSLLACQGHAVCIMPTGSGKSLIFYLFSLLQPLPIFVVSPTEILIRDQIRNLQKFHHIDNISHLKLTARNDFSKFELHNSLLYLTPMTFQNRHLLVKFRYINSDQQISFVVLDEIHCLSNWGHDFRPEYLMLSKFLNKYLDRTAFRGFTATANYTVVDDIQKQLSIPQENIISPVALKKNNVNYTLKSVPTTEAMFQEACSLVERLNSKNERTVIFTKSDAISIRLADAIGYEADVYQSDNPSGYHHFVENKCKVLVTCEELGVGINLPDVSNTIHFGLPLSKSEFIQEVGRAGRGDENVHSYVIYLQPTEKNVPLELLHRTGSINSISAVARINNDYADVFMRLNNHLVSKEELCKELIQLYKEYNASQRPYHVSPFPVATIESTKKYLYMLYVIGYVNDWYSYNAISHDTIRILVDISSTNHYHYLQHPNLINRVKARAVDYYAFMGNDREFITKTSRANDIEEIIGIYVDWYYAKYLYHHREMFLDLLDFISNSQKKDSETITEELKDFFTLPFIQIKSDEEVFGSLSLKQAISKLAQGIQRPTLANLERINSNQYSYILDCCLLLGGLRLDDRLDTSRFDRVLSNILPQEFEAIKDALVKIFPSCSVETKLQMLKFAEQNFGRFDMQVLDFLDDLYVANKKDAIYYGVLSLYVNKKFRHCLRRSS